MPSKLTRFKIEDKTICSYCDLEVQHDDLGWPIHKCWKKDEDKSITTNQPSPLQPEPPWYTAEQVAELNSKLTEYQTEKVETQIEIQLYEQVRYLIIT